MSLTTWKAEFYPCSAHAMETASPVDVVQHSLNKWRGMRIENLTRHGCKSTTYRDVSDSEGYILIISGSSCSLCQAYLGKEGDDGSRCSKCPLCVVRDSRPCDSPRGIDHTPPEPVSPWGMWMTVTDPEPMIEWLEKTLRYVQEKEQSRA